MSLVNYISKIRFSLFSFSWALNSKFNIIYKGYILAHIFILNEDDLQYLGSNVTVCLLVAIIKLIYLVCSKN